MALQLSALKGAALKQIAFKCGIQHSGVKASIIKRLQDEIPLSSRCVAALNGLKRTSRSHTRILSIDMGIRNLAYCVLDVPAGSGNPSIMDWKRLAVSSAPVAETGDNEGRELEKESFEPHVLSAAAYELLRKNLLVHEPTHILIERQRFRSMGSPRILEWTVRVNMLESMFYATLHTLQEEGLWKGKVVPIAPGKVGPFWLEGDAAASPDADAEGEVKIEKLSKVRNAKLSKIQNKGAKIDLVRNWLASGDRFELGSQEVVDMTTAYLEKWRRKPGSPKGKRASKDAAVVFEKMGKLDDLADCLLQGMAFIEWDANKRTARELGVDRLLDK